MAGVRRQALDRGDAAPGEVLDRVQASVVGLAVDVNGARATLANAAAELGSGELEVLAQYPQQRGIGERSYGMTLAVDGQRNRGLRGHDTSSRQPDGRAAFLGGYSLSASVPAHSSAVGARWEQPILRRLYPSGCQPTRKTTSWRLRGADTGAH